MARKAKSNQTKQGSTGALPAPQALRQAGDLSACGDAQAGQPSGNLPAGRHGAQFSLPPGGQRKQWERGRG